MVWLQLKWAFPKLRHTNTFENTRNFPLNRISLINIKWKRFARKKILKHFFSSNAYIFSLCCDVYIRIIITDGCSFIEKKKKEEMKSQVHFRVLVKRAYS